MRRRPTDSILSLRRSLGDSLFVSAPETASRFRRGEATILIVAFLALATILQLFRIGPGIALDSLWAEDGPIFLGGAMSEGLLDALSSTYGGYFVLAPRLIGEVGNLFALRDAAAAIALASAFIVALSGLVIWFASAALIRNPYLRGTLVALTVLAPVASLESVASGSYVLWYMLVATFWVLLWRPGTTLAAVLGALFVLATALSTIGIWFLAPLAALRAIAVRDRRDVLLVGAYALGAAIQVPALALSDESQVEPLWSADIWTAYLQRVVDGAAFGERLGGEAWELLGWHFLIVLLALLLAGLALGLRRANLAARWLAAVAVPTSLVMFVVSAYQRAVGSQMMWPADIHFGNGGRYAIVPALLLVSLALVIVEDVSRRQRVARRAKLIVGVTVALLLSGMAISFDLRNSAARGTPSWREAMDRASAECRQGDLEAASLPISPPPFSIAVSCEELDRG